MRWKWWKGKNPKLLFLIPTFNQGFNLELIFVCNQIWEFFTYKDRIFETQCYLSTSSTCYPSYQIWLLNYYLSVGQTDSQIFLPRIPCILQKMNYYHILSALSKTSCWNLHWSWNIKCWGNNSFPESDIFPVLILRTLIVVLPY